jgi:hypothetical protein
VTDYVTVEELRDRIGSDTTTFQAHAQRVCTVASRLIERLCDRTFVTESSTSTLYLLPDSSAYVSFDADVHTTTSLVLTTDDNADNTYSTTWTINTDFVLEPRSQRQGHRSGWPYQAARAIGTKTFPMRTSPFQVEPVKLVAKLGWASVPDEVVEGTLVAAAKLFKMKDAADGFVGVDGWGLARLRVEFKEAYAVVCEYARAPIAVA